MACWSISPFFFTAAGRRIGALALNLNRLLLALIVLSGLSVFMQLSTDTALPSWKTSLLLLVSGAVGLGVGDFFMYRSLSAIGPERTSLFMTMSPAATALTAFLALDERLSILQVMGMTLVLTGVVASTWKPALRFPTLHSRPAPFALMTPAFWGTAWNALLASLCQGMGAAIARHAFLREESLSPINATNLRIAGAVLLLFGVVQTRGGLMPIVTKARDPYVFKRIAAGSVVGPIIGMLCYVAGLKYAPAGIVTTITFMTPLIIIPLGSWHYGNRPSARLLLGAIVSLGGVLLLGF